MTKMIQKSVILTAVLSLLLAAAAAPSAMAQDRCDRSGYTSSRDYNNDYRHDRYYDDDYRRDRYRNDYYNPQATTGKAVGRRRRALASARWLAR